MLFPDVLPSFQLGPELRDLAFQIVPVGLQIGNLLLDLIPVPFRQSACVESVGFVIPQTSQTLQSVSFVLSELLDCATQFIDPGLQIAESILRGACRCLRRSAFPLS